MSMAKAVISGTVASEPEKRFTPNTNAAVTNFTIAVDPASGGGNRQAEQGPFYVRVTCWRGLADAAVEQLQKGDAVLVDGKLTINSYQDQDGVQKRNYEIDAASLNKLSSLPQTLTPVISNEEGAAPRRSGSAPVGVAQAHPQQAAYATNPVAVATPPQNSNAQQPLGVMSDDLLMTEDDIPF